MSIDIIFICLLYIFIKLWAVTDWIFWTKIISISYKNIIIFSPYIRAYISEIVLLLVTVNIR